MRRKIKTEPNKVYCDFLRWFLTQYGARPASATKDAELLARIEDGELARDKLNSCRLYDLRRDAAYKSWIAREQCQKK